MDNLEKIYGYFDRQPGLHALFIFDPMGIIAADLQDVEWKPGYVYEVYDGRSFRVKYNLEHEWKASKLVLLLQQPRPQSDADFQSFPLLDILSANREFAGESAEYFLQDKGLPSHLRAYVERNLERLQLKMVRRILENYFNKDATEDIFNRGVISAYLDANTLLDWTTILVKLVLMNRESEETRRDRFFDGVSKCRDALEAVEQKATKVFGYQFGVKASRNYLDMLNHMARSLKYNSLCGLLPIHKADDYAKYKVTSVNALDQINQVWDAAFTNPLYAGAMSEVLRDVAGVIQEDRLLKWYGEEAEYYRLTDELCYPVVSELLKEKLYADPAELGSKVRDMMQKNPDSLGVLKFVARLCDFYAAKAGIKTLRLNTPAEYVSMYSRDFYLLDMYYRQALELFTEARKAPIEDDLRAAKVKLDSDYAEFCNRLNLEWTECLVSDKDGLSGVDMPRQQNFYDTYRKEGVKQVVIVSDALRYEVGMELVQTLLKSKHTARMDCAMAMLPTETKYCKPALLPHRELSIDLGTNGSAPNLLVDGYLLASTDTRADQVDSIVPGATCVQFRDVIKASKDENRELFKRPLVYIMHDIIDDDGHDCDADKLAEACRKCIDEIATLVPKLHATFNVANVSIVSDHGFLFNDMAFEDKDKHVITEDCFEKKTRYYLTTSRDEVPGVIKFPLSAVSGIPRDDVLVGVPRGANRLAAPGGGYQFAHGGCALQEIIIPVIHSNSRREDSKKKVGVKILPYRRSERDLVMTSSRLQFKLLQTESVSADSKERMVVYGMYDNGKLVSEEREFKLESTSGIPDERKTSLEITLSVSTNANKLELRVYDVEDRDNPLDTSLVKNNTLIEQDF